MPKFSMSVYSSKKKAVSTYARLPATKLLWALSRYSKLDQLLWTTTTFCATYPSSISHTITLFANMTPAVQVNVCLSIHTLPKKITFSRDFLRIFGAVSFGNGWSTSHPDLTQLTATFANPENKVKNAFSTDGAPPHAGRQVKVTEHIDRYPPCWIGRFGPRTWPARSPSYTHLKHTNGTVCRQKSQTRDKLYSLLTT
jgi:hypothetical protein